MTIKRDGDGESLSPKNAKANPARSAPANKTNNLPAEIKIAPAETYANADAGIILAAAYYGLEQSEPISADLSARALERLGGLDHPYAWGEQPGNAPLYGLYTSALRSIGARHHPSFDGAPDGEELKQSLAISAALHNLQGTLCDDMLSERTISDARERMRLRGIQLAHEDASVRRSKTSEAATTTAHKLAAYERIDEYTAAIVSTLSARPDAPAIVHAYADGSDKIRDYIERLGSDKQAGDAIAGTRFGDAADIFRRVSIEGLPLALGVAKAVAMYSHALSQPNAERNGPRLWINTGDRQALNLHPLLIWRSASGKDIGDLSRTVARRLEAYIGTGASREAFAEMLMEIPHGLISISELAPYLRKGDYKSHCAEFFTEIAFGKHFRERLAHGAIREANYCAPTFAAQIQPATFGTLATSAMIDSGFLGRFLILVPPPSLIPRVISSEDCEQDIARLEDIARRIGKHSGGISVPMERCPAGKAYACQLPTLMSHANNAPDILRPWVARLCNQFGPRLAVYLSANDGEPIDLQSRRADETWQRAEILCAWLWRQASTALGLISDTDPRQQRLETLIGRIARMVKRRGGKVLKRVADTGLSRGTTAKERDAALSEGVERGWLRLSPDGRIIYLDSAPESLFLGQV